MSKDGYYIKQSGERFEIESYKSVVWLDDSQLTSLILHKGVTWVSCERNQLTSLILYKGVRTVWCDMMDGIEQQYKKDMTMQISQSNYE